MQITYYWLQNDLSTYTYLTIVDQQPPKLLHQPNNCHAQKATTEIHVKLYSALNKTLTLMPSADQSVS